MSSRVFGWPTLSAAICTLALLVPVAAARSATPIASAASDVPAHITAKLSSSRPRTASNWWLTPVTVTFTCVVGSTPLQGSCPSPVRLSRGVRRESVTRTVTDADGQKSSVTVSRINIDLAGPTVRILGPEADHVYSGRVPKAVCKGYDKLAGLRSCALTTATKPLSNRHRVTISATVIARSGATAVTRLSYLVTG